MADIATLQPAHGVGKLVLISPDRNFMLPGDDDPASPVHGYLVVRSVEPSAPWEYDLFTYALAENMKTPHVYIVPERAIETL